MEVSREWELQGTGRSWFLVGIANLLCLPLFFALIYVDTHWLPEVAFIRTFAMLFGVLSFGAFGLGAWYGERKTRRNCLVIMAVMFPILTMMIFSYIVNGPF